MPTAGVWKKIIYCENSKLKSKTEELRPRRRFNWPLRTAHDMHNSKSGKQHEATEMLESVYLAETLEPQH